MIIKEEIQRKKNVSLINLIIIFIENQTGHGDLSWQIPQVFPAASLIYPFSPQFFPQEFLIFQIESITPTSNTSWSRSVEQLLNIPLL